MRSGNVTIHKYVVGVVLAHAVLIGACKRAPDPAPPGGSTTTAELGCLETAPPPASAAKCMTCIKANAINAGGDGCCGIKDATGRQLCEAAASCMRTGKVAGGPCNVGGDTSTCYCGTNQVNCWLKGVPNGPCISTIAAAAGRNIETQTTDTPNEDQILTRYGDVKYALGRASNVAAIAGAFCPAECELKK
jgi:hypothetical protein